MTAKDFRRILAIGLLAIAPTFAMASGTEAGTDVTNTATLSYGDSTDSLTDVQSNAETFKVDKKIDLTVDTIDATPISTKPNATGVVLTFRVTNTGNSVQDFALNALTTSTSAFGGSVTDSFDAQNVKVYVDSNDNGTYEPDTDTQTYIDELGIDQSIIVFVVSDMPGDLQDGAAAVYDLQAQVAEGGSGGSQGAVIAQDDSDKADNKLTVQIVFADGAGTADGEHDGKFSNVDAYKITIANMTITKTSVVVEDPINGTQNPKRIPGATIRYCFTVENSGTSDASIARIAEDVDESVYDVSGLTNSDIRIYSGDADFDCSNVANLTTADNNGSVDASTGQMTIDLGGVPAGKKKSAYFEVQLQ